MASNFQCCSEHLKEIPDDYKTVLTKILPSGHEQLVCAAYPELKNNINCVRFSLRLKTTTRESFEVWLKDFQDKTLTTYRTIGTGKGLSRVVYKSEYICQHQSSGCKKYKKPSKKTLSCNAFIYVSVKAKPKFRTRSKDIHIHEWLTKVTLLWGHSHPLDDPFVLKYRDVRPATRQRLLEFFSQGYHIHTAHCLLKHELRLAGLEHPLAEVDKAFIPELDYLARLQKHFFMEKLGLHENISALGSIYEILARIKSRAIDEGVKTEATIVEGEVVIAMTTPIMERVHTLAPQSAQFVFVDSIDMIEKNKCIVRLLVTHSPSGALPLGCLLSTSASAQCTEQGLRLLQTILPAGAFYGQGRDGPKVWLTKGWNDGECQALRSVFPQGKQALSSHHMLYTLWSLMYNKHSIAKGTDRLSLLNKLKEMLSATSMEELEQIYETFVITAKMKSKLIEHFSQIWNSRHGWAIPLTRIEQCGDCPTYNFFQKVFQGLPFQRQGLSFLQVFTYTAHVLSQQHRANILHMLSVYESKAKLPPDARGLSADPVLKDTRVSHMNGDLYEVCLDGQTYLLDDSVSFCTCMISKRCTCKHLLALRHYQACLWSTDDPLTCGDQRKLYLEIATGHTEWDVEKGNRQQVKSLEAGRMKRSGDSEAFCGDSEGDIDGDESDTESASSVTVHPENTNTSHRDVKCTSILKKLFAEKPHFLKPTIINKIKTKIFLNATEKAKRDLRSSESREGKTILDPVVKCVAESASQLHLALQCDEMESSHSAHIETETQTERNILSGATGQTSKNSTSHKTESVCKRTSIQATDQTSKNSITNTIGSISKNSTVLATSHTSKNSITNTTGSISKNSTVPATSHTSKNSIANATGSISKNSTILVTDHSSKNNAINTIGSISNNSTVLATSHTSKNSITNTTGSISKNSTIGTDHSSKNNTINTIGSICKNLTVLVTDRTSKNKTTYTIRPISKKPTDTTGSMVKNPKNTTEPISKNLINTTGCISQNPTNTTGCISKNLTNTAGSISKNPTNTTGCISKNPTNAAGSISKNLTNTTGSISKNPTLTALRDPVEEAIREFDAVSTRIKQALRENPSVLLKPFQTFVEEGKQRLNSAASLAGLFTKEDRTTTSSGMKLSPCSTPIVIYSSSCYREDCTKCNFRSRMKRSHTGDTLPVVPTKKKALDPQVSKNNNTCAE